MNGNIFIHYGIGNKVVITFENGEVNLTERKATSWSYPNEVDEMVEFNSPMLYQQYHAQFSPVAHTSADVPMKNQRRTKAEF